MAILLYKNIFKSIFDRLLALIALIITIPFIIITYFIIRFYIGKPVFFAQKRPGLNEEIFTIYKFRTMTDERDKNGDLLLDEMRLKGVGKIIRSLSLDELPQLFNVIKGEMSIVGPRPLLIEYLPLYNKKQKRRHNVKPGITGLAQIKGRNSISWQEKFDYDIEYVDNISLWLDIKIIYWTIIKVIKKDGISQNGNATMEKFRGNN
jgi:undecaprenyl phosphate N,N'-diacetylbacillosamine 1-phosphate transferase